mmetsp:Transcript_21525/g.52726  ORF Transcript_21525/g.52726 Transcript_21525/m.52726 type:complete len:309 (+) Transcript_21525:76-1002(+)
MNAPEARQRSDIGNPDKGSSLWVGSNEREKDTVASSQQASQSTPLSTPLSTPKPDARADKGHQGPTHRRFRPTIAPRPGKRPGKTGNAQSNGTNGVEGEDETKAIEDFKNTILQEEARSAVSERLSEDVKESSPTLDAEAAVQEAEVRASGLYKPEINCVFAFLHLRVPLDLVHIVTRVRDAEYNPKRFHAVVLRIRAPKATAMIYASGKLVCMGAKNERAAHIACRKFVRILQKVGYPEVKFSPTEKEPLIRNVMAKCKVPFPVRLEDLAVAHSDFVSYEPEIFPGLIYRMAEPKFAILGAKNCESP